MSMVVYCNDLPPPPSSVGGARSVPAPHEEFDNHPPVWALTNQELDADEELWRKARDYKAAVLLNKKYLRSEINATPYNRGPISDQTFTSWPAFLRLHDLGFLVYDEQHSKHDGPILIHSQHRWYESRQRAYLCFMVPSDLQPAIGASFINNLKAHEGIVTRIIECSLNYTVEFRVDGTAGADTMHVLAERFAPSPPALEDTAWMSLKAMNENPLPPPVWTGPRWRGCAVVDARPLDITVVARNWEPLDLKALVEEAAIRSSVPRAYAS